MQSDPSADDGPLSLTEFNRSFKLALEGWLSCKDHQKDKGSPSEELEVKLETREQLLVLVAHLVFLALGFEVQDKEPRDSCPKLTSDWNATEPYTFDYFDPSLKHRFQLKAITAGKRLFIHAIALEAGETYSFDVLPEVYGCNQTLFPLKFDSTELNPELDLSFVFDGSANLKKYLNDLQLNLVKKLVPDLPKESNQGTSLEEKLQPSPLHSRSSQERQDNLGPASATSTPSNFQPGRHPLAYGDRDLDPLGGLGPRPPRFGGGSSAVDPFGLIGDDQGGMILGPHHPMFTNPDAHPIPGDHSRLPPGAVPPGARFDPITPLGPSIRDPRSQLRGQRPRPPFSGEPDNDEAPPPGYDHMFM